MKYTFLVLSFIIYASSSVFGQRGAVTSGGSAIGTGGSVEYSIGQTNYTTLSSLSGTVTQGLQQPYEILIITGIEHKDIDLKMSAYPNPASDFVVLNLSIINYSDCEYVLQNIEGKVLIKNPITNNENQISLSEYNNETFLLSVIRSNQIVKTFKILKSK